MSLPEGFTRAPFSVIVADPPWSFGDKLPGKSRGAEKNYPVMKVGDMADRGFVYHKEIHEGTAPNALLFMWRVASQVEEANTLVRAWGFSPKSEIVWVKIGKGVTHHPSREGTGLHFGMGRYVRMAHESCIIATRGKAIPLIQSHSERSILFAEVGRHSEKPEAFYDLVERLARGPYLELFARRKRPGWTCLGNEIDT